jgi:predicted  nucleic acid-binding Zn-ribbon protein
MECISCGEMMERVGEGWECPDCGMCLFEFDSESDYFNPDGSLPERIDADYDFDTGTFLPSMWINLDADTDEFEDELD